MTPHCEWCPFPGCDSCAYKGHERVVLLAAWREGPITNRGRWVLRVCADRYLDATFELDSPAGCVVVGPGAS
jgi:hypothetical protein